MKNQINIFTDFKNNFKGQKREKKMQLNKLFLSGKYDLNLLKKENKDKIEDNLIINLKNSKEKKNILELELSNGEKIKTKNTYLKKYPNSVLAAYLNPENKFPKRNGHIFIDRDPKILKIYYII